MTQRKKTWHTAPVLIYAVYRRPAWSKAEIVCIEWLLDVHDGEARSLPLVHEFDTLEEARAIVPGHLHRHDPLPTDEPAQVEAWM